MLSVSKIFLISLLASIIFAGCSNNETTENNVKAENKIAHKSNSPDLIQTQNFITNKMLEYVGVANREQEIRFKECKILKYQGKTTIGTYEKDGGFLNLKYFNPNTVEYNREGDVIFYITDGTKRVVSDYNRGEYVDTFNYMDIKVKSAPKVAKAISHLIKLCGGKGELF